jgi:nucleoporin GLE1
MGEADAKRCLRMSSLDRTSFSLLTSYSIQKTASRAVASAQSQLDALQVASRELHAGRQANDLRKEADLVAERLAELSVRHAVEEEESGTRWDKQRRARQAQTENIIHSEVDKQRAKQKEEERIAKEEAERIRKEAEKAAAEEQRKKEEAAKAIQEAEEAKARAEKEEAARKEAERVEQAKTQALGAQTTERNALGMTTPDDDWRAARLALKVRFPPSIRLPSLTQHVNAAIEVRTDRTRQG